MRMTPLASFIHTHCMERDGHTHRWAHFYLLSYQWLRMVKDRRTYPVRSEARIPVSGRIVRIPGDMEVASVGVDVRGTFVPLLENQRMLDLADECGDPDPGITGNPDFPAVNVGAAYSPMPAVMHWPGQGGGKSVRGYYRRFPEKGYILLDSTSRYESVIVRGGTPSFVPGMYTYIPEACCEALRAWLVWQPLEARKSVNLSLTRSADDARREYALAMRNLRSSLQSEPLEVIIAAVKSGLGQIRV